MQSRAGLPSCVLGCGPGAADSIEHYAACPKLAALSLRVLRLARPDPPRRLADFLGVMEADPDDSLQVRRAIRLAALYRIHCQACHGVLRTGRLAREAFPQACREVVRGCAAGERIFDAAAGGEV